MFDNKVCKFRRSDIQLVAVFLHLSDSPLSVIIVVADIQPDRLLL